MFGVNEISSGRDSRMDRILIATSHPRLNYTRLGTMLRDRTRRVIISTANSQSVLEEHRLQIYCTFSIISGKFERAEDPHIYWVDIYTAKWSWAWIDGTLETKSDFTPAFSRWDKDIEGKKPTKAIFHPKKKIMKGALFPRDFFRTGQNFDRRQWTI